MTREVSHNAFYSSNHKNALRKTADDRRYCMLYTAQQDESDLERDGMGTDYFTRLFDWIKREEVAAALRWYFEADPIPPEFDYTVGAIRAPKSSSHDEAIKESRGAAEDELDEMIQQHRSGFRGDWISTTALELMLQRIGKLREVGRKKWPALLKTFDYIPHPALPNGRAPEPIDGVIPQLYVKRDSAPAKLKDPVSIVAAYRKANGAA